MKKILILFVLCALCIGVQAQKVFQTKSGKIKFYSSAPLENIEAINNQVDSKLATNGQTTFMLGIKGFRFENATMQEHFNENYMESTKFPKAVFLGNITNIASVNFDKDGSYKVSVTGDLEIHGVKKKITIEGTIDIKAGKVAVKSKFNIKLSDFNIKGSLIGEKIAKEVEVTVDCKYD